MQKITLLGWNERQWETVNGSVPYLLRGMNDFSRAMRDWRMKNIEEPAESETVNHIVGCEMMSIGYSIVR